MSNATIKKKRQPTHPGEFLREIVLSASKLSVTELARRLHASRQTVHDILRGAAPVTANIAVRLAALFGTSAEVWTNMQGAYDVWEARHRNVALLREIASKAVPAEVVA